MDKEAIIKKVSKLKSMVFPRFRPKDVYLFGSYAKGIATNDSDIDVAFIYDEYNGDLLEDLAFLFKVSHEIDYRMEPIIIDQRSDLTGFLSEIKKTGVAV